jgi:hypothetical protein
MKIQSIKNNHKGNKVKLGNDVIEFDKNGVFEIEEAKKAKELIQKYPFLHEEGKAPKVKKSVEKPQTDKELERALNVATQKVTNLTKDLESKEKEVQAWKDQFEKASEGQVSGITGKDIETIIDISLAEEKEVYDLCKEAKYPVKEWEKLKGKELSVYFASKLLIKE